MKTKLNFSAFLLVVVLWVACEREAKEWGVPITYSSVTELKMKIAENTSLEYGVDTDIDIEDISHYGPVKHFSNSEMSFSGPIKTFPVKFVLFYKPEENFTGTDTLEFSYIVESSIDTDKIDRRLLRFIVEVQEKNVYNYSSEISATLHDHTPYTYFLGMGLFPKEYEIITPPSHASSCEITGLDDYPGVYFRYIPQEGFTGKDHVEIISYGIEESDNYDTLVRSLYNKYRFAIEVR